VASGRHAPPPGRDRIETSTAAPAIAFGRGRTLPLTCTRAAVQASSPMPSDGFSTRPVTRRRVPAQARLVARHALGLIPNCWWNHRVNALGAVNPSSCPMSVIEYRSLAR
jgi:hypothetical protein